MNILKKCLIHSPRSPESGYTVLEGLMAIVVVSVLLLAMGPVIAFSVGTRVQAKRVELATQAARTYIDGVKSGSIDIPTQIADFTPAVADLAGDCKTKDAYCTNTKLYCVNFDDAEGCQDKSQTDMLVQPVRKSYSTGTSADSDGYKLAIRVYRANSFATGVGNLQPTPSSTNVTNAVGDRTRPLVVINAQVATSSTSLEVLRNSLTNPSP